MQCSRIWLSYFFILTFSISVHAQDTKLLQDSVYHYLYLSPSKTQYFVNKIQPIYKEKKQWEKYLFGFYDIAESYFQQGDYKKTKEYLNKALGEGASVELSKLNIIYSYIWNLKGVLADLDGNFYRAAMYFEASLNVDNNQTNTLNEAKAVKYINLASAYDEFGDYKQANAYYKKALLLVEPSDFEKKAEIYNGLGFINTNLREYDIAEMNYEKALTLYKKYNYNRVSLFSNLAEFYRHKKEYEKALDYLNKKLQFPKLTQRSLASTYEAIGSIFFEQQKYEKALDTMQVALEIRNKALPEKHHVIAQTYFLQGNIHQAKNNYSKALISYQKAIQAVVFDFESDDTNINPTLNNVLHQVELLKALSAKANTQSLLQQNKQALATYKICSQLIDKMRISFQNDASKLFLMEQGVLIYEKAIQVALEIDDLKIAFQFSEKSKAVLLLEAFRGIEARFGLPNEIVEQEQEFKGDITFYERKIWEEKQKDDGNTDKVKNWENLIFDLKEKYTVLQEHIKKTYPDYFQLKYKTIVADVKSIQGQLLNDKTAMISYFFGVSEVYIFTIFKDKMEVSQVEKPSNLNSSINDLRRFLKQDPSLENAHLKYYEIAHQLYQSFVFPAVSKLPNSIQQLVIIPDDVLSYVPFETLLTAQPTFKSPRYEFKKMPYLIKEYQISYGYAGTLLLEGLNKKKGENLKPFGGFAPSFAKTASSRRDCNNGVLGDLVYGRKNLEVINNIMEGNLHFNQEATLGNFREIADEYNILHLCTHACAAGSFQDTRIYFSDQALLGFELYNLPLKAQLAVLSACETGVGEIKKGEGVMSLARAFMYSGCPSVVMSLWSVDDKSTSELMQLFYKNIKAGQSKDKALHQAKLDYLDNKGVADSHPFYWSGFVQIGNTTAMYPSPMNRSILILGIGLFLVMLSFFGYKKLKTV